MPSSTSSQPDILYLVLHGLISIVETPTNLQLYVINIGPDHVYQGGNWGAWTPLTQGVNGTLSGVKDGGVGTDPVANPVVKIQSAPAADGSNVYCVITIPKPRKLYSIDQGNIKIKSGANLLVETPKTLSGVRVLEYEVQTKLEDISLNFGPHSQFWNAGFSIARLSESQRIAALHISNAPPDNVSMPGTHNIDEFALSCQVLGATVQINEPVEVTPTPDSALPLGLSRIELGLDFPRLRFHLDIGGCQACCGGADGRVGGHG